MLILVPRAAFQGSSHTVERPSASSDCAAADVSWMSGGQLCTYCQEALGVLFLSPERVTVSQQLYVFRF